MYLRARWYNGRTGTFTSKDSFAGWPEQPYSLMPYQYSYSAPTTWTDPRGRAVSDGGDGGGSSPCPTGQEWNATTGRCEQPQVSSSPDPSSSGSSGPISLTEPNPDAPLIFTPAPATPEQEIFVPAPSLDGTEIFVSGPTLPGQELFTPPPPLNDQLVFKDCDEWKDLFPERVTIDDKPTKTIITYRDLDKTYTGNQRAVRQGRATGAKAVLVRPFEVGAKAQKIKYESFRFDGY